MSEAETGKIRKYLRLSALTVAAAFALPALSYAAALNLSTEPMYLGNTALPNLMFTLDDSGSMGRDYMPDEANDNNTCKGGNNCQAGDPPYYASDYNAIYYNPEVTYEPAVDANGNSYDSYGSPWTSVPVDAYRIRSTATANLTNSIRDKEYCSVTTVKQATFNLCGTSPSLCKSGSVVTVISNGHGLVTGEKIDVVDANNCDPDARVTSAAVTVIDANTFTYDEGGTGAISTNSNNRKCRVEKKACLRHGITTNNPFEYRVPPAPTTDDPVIYGLPADVYTTATNISINPFFYKIIAQEYCSDRELIDCVAASAAADPYTYPAPVRFCDTQASADADVPVNDATMCQGQYVAGSFTFPRYGKFYRQDIEPATATYGNVVVDGYTVINRSGRTDCTGAPNCTYTEEMTNYANWFAYYSIRLNAMKTGVGKAFAELPGNNFRVGFGRINEGSNTIETWSSPGTLVQGVRVFTGTHKADWFSYLYNSDASGSTPLRQAMDDVGQYYMYDGSRGPWGTDPATGQVLDASGTLVNEAITNHATCRQSYHILSSDGYWNSNAARTSGAQGDVDSTAGVTSGSYNYLAVDPYTDGYGGTLADVAMYYWKNDLRTDLADDVKKNEKDGATWQHMVNFTIGLGVNGTLDPTTPLQDFIDGYTVWPQAVQNSPTGIDDMWHATVNSKGSHFSVRNTAELVASLKEVFKDIGNRTSSASSVAIDASIMQTDRYIYQSKFFTSDWSGTVKALPIDLLTGTIGTEIWDAQTQLDAQDPYTGRFIATWDPAAVTPAGVRFRWSSLNATQQAALNKDISGTTDGLGSDRVDYIRGVEFTAFRSRNHKLGDIVHTSPVFVGPPVKSYTSASYKSFASTWAGRDATLYVSANDGMLHALDAASGDERFAFVPNAVIGKLNTLTAKNYTHQYFVDGPITVEDVEISGSWTTVLAGALGNGGKSVYALDITDPVLSGATVAAKEADLASKVLWEFTDADLGYVRGEIAIVKMANGVWAAIFGNGYNNTGTGEAALYIVNIATGAQIAKFNVGNGSTVTPSGMAAPLPVDINGDAVADYIYAGDLEGNVWKFDVTSTTPGNWGSSFYQGSTPKPLFTATDSFGTPQPITSRVDVGRHQYGSGYMVYFGTGKYLESGDNSQFGQDTQTFYGIWDKVNYASGVGNNYPSFTRNHLLTQTIDYQLDPYTDPITKELLRRGARVTSDYGIAWYMGSGNPATSPSLSEHLGWKMDLAYPTITANHGERVIFNPILLAGRIIFPTFLPPADPCTPGGDSWLMELDAIDGSRLEQSVWDVNIDKSVDEGDKVDIGGTLMQVSGAKSSVGAVASPRIVTLPGAQRQVKITAGSREGEIETTYEDPGAVARGRQSWIRLQ